MNLFVDTICQRTCHALEELFPAGEWKNSEIKALIEQPPDAEMGDFALPCFSFSKKLRRSPKQIAEELENLLTPEPSEDQITDSRELLPFSRIKAFGPYLNFFLDPETLARELLPSIFQKSSTGDHDTSDSGKGGQGKIREKVMIEFSQPNTHKGFHVGHLRNAALGDSLCMIFP